MNEVLLGDTVICVLYTVRERIQRWLVVQRQTTRVNKGIEILTLDKTPVLLAFLKRRSEQVTGWVQRTCIDSIRMILSPTIRVALFFEKELVYYFEVTYAWHANPGELCTRPGFRAMELTHIF